MTDWPNTPAAAADPPSADPVTLQKALVAQKDDYLRLAADFDNFKKRSRRDAEQRATADDPHLRSAREADSYTVEATDGALGEVVDFRMDGKTWMIRQLVAECGHSYAGKEIAIPTYRVARISYGKSTVYLDSSKQAITEPSDPAQAHAQ